jgi:hypothetical protein
MLKKKTERELWITNISRKHDVSLSDLCLTIRRGQSINLLDRRNRYTEEQIKNSIESGSIFKKNSLIKIREVAPVIFNYRLDISNDRSSLNTIHHKLEIENPKYEELDFDTMTRESDEKYAQENAEMDLLDTKPTLFIDPKFKKLEEE